MHSPPFKFEYNLNTLAILVGFAAGLVAWGYSISGWNATTMSLVKLEERVGRLDDVVRTADRLEYRVTVNESADKARDERMDRFSDVIQSLRSSLSEIITKIEVVSSKTDTVVESLKERRSSLRPDIRPTP